MDAIIDLINNYSFSSIFMFICMLALAIKGFVDFYDWAKARIQKKINAETNEINREQNIEVKVQSLEEHQKNIDESLEKICKNIQTLMDSDKDDIKAWITEKHHYYYYEKKVIDDFTLECMERRYSHYKDEGGNSFIDSMMQEIRSLPRVIESEEIKDKNKNNR